jgi:hypothetical protein
MPEEDELKVQREEELVLHDQHQEAARRWFPGRTR